MYVMSNTHEIRLHRLFEVQQVLRSVALSSRCRALRTADEIQHMWTPGTYFVESHDLRKRPLLRAGIFFISHLS